MRRAVAIALSIILVLPPEPALAHNELDALTNDFRERNGRVTLTTPDNLRDLAQQRAREIAEDFRHEFWWVNHTSCAVGGENIGWARPPTDPGTRADWFFSAWRQSDSHRAMMLGAGWRRMGSSIMVIGDTMYGVQLFCDPT